jgi:hypothetical protein
MSSYRMHFEHRSVPGTLSHYSRQHGSVPGTLSLYRLHKYRVPGMMADDGMHICAHDGGW